MHHRNRTENHYCCPCRCTTRHRIEDQTLTCLQCGSVKRPAKPRRSLARYISTYVADEESRLRPINAQTFDMAVDAWLGGAD